MDISLIVFCVTVAFFAYRGFRRGLGASLSRILGLLAGYGVAIIFTPSLSAWLQAETELQGIAVFLLAGISLFLGGGLLVSLMFSLVARLFVKKQTLSTASSVGGGVVGILAGIVIGLTLVWGLDFLQTLQFAKNAENTAFAEQKSQKTTTDDSKPASENPVVRDTRVADGRDKKNAIEKAAAYVAGSAVTVAAQAMNISPEMSQASKALIQSPGQTVVQMQRLFKSEPLTTLLNERHSQTLLQQGNTRAVVQLPAFQRLIEHPDFSGLMQAAGLSVQSEEQIAVQLSRLWRRAQQVKNNPQLQDIMSDPAFLEQLQSGNPFALLTNPKLQTLADIVYTSGIQEPVTQPGEFSSESASDFMTGDTTRSVPVIPDADRASTTAKPETKIYRWVDDQGRVHYSDKKTDQK